jgi:hypothetical protein
MLYSLLSARELLSKGGVIYGVTEDSDNQSLKIIGGKQIERQKVSRCPGITYHHYYGYHAGLLGCCGSLLMESIGSQHS